MDKIFNKQCACSPAVPKTPSGIGRRNSAHLQYHPPGRVSFPQISGSGELHYTQSRGASFHTHSCHDTHPSASNLPSPAVFPLTIRVNPGQRENPGKATSAQSPPPLPFPSLPSLHPRPHYPPSSEAQAPNSHNHVIHSRPNHKRTPTISEKCASALLRCATGSVFRAASCRVSVVCQPTPTHTTYRTSRVRVCAETGGEGMSVRDG